MGDEPSLAKNINNKKIYKNTATIPHPYTIKDAEYWIDANLKSAKNKNPDTVNFAIVIGGNVIGSIGLLNIKINNESKIGYWLAERYWGKGIMPKVVKLITEYGFKKLKLKRIYAEVFSFNKGSKRVLEKSGFKLEKILRKHHKKDGKLIDICLFVKTR